MDQTDFSTLLPGAIRAAARAAPAILEVYRQDFQVQEKADRSPITEADRRSQGIIAETLSRLAWQQPIPLLSEEDAEIPYADRRDWPLFWLVDPLDGTKEFVKRNGEFTTNIALIQNNRPVLGVVYAPVPDLLYFALAGLGAYKLDRLMGRHGSCLDQQDRGLYDCLLRHARGLPLEQYRRAKREEKQEDRSRIVVAGSRSHSSRSFDAFIGKLKRSYREVVVVSKGSALKICMVAEGSADIYPRFGPTMEWDTAAAHVVANQAGRRLITFNAGKGEPFHEEAGNSETGRELVYNKPDLRQPGFIAR